MSVVTWTFDLLALFIGFIVGVFCGAIVYCTVEMRDGGSWSKGFSEGWNAKHDYLKTKEKEDAHGTEFECVHKADSEG